MAPTRKNKNSRKASRKNKKDRKSRKGSRKCWSRKQAGGNPMAQSLDQGKQYMEFHAKQHGGAYLTGAPLSMITDSRLPTEMRDFARVGGLDASIADAATQRDPDQVPAQNGGRRKSGRKSGRKASKKSKKSKKNRKASKKSKKNRKASKKSKKNRKSRRQAGGALAGAPFNQPTMLLTSAEAAKAGTADFSNPLLKH